MTVTSAKPITKVSKGTKIYLSRSAIGNSLHGAGHRAEDEGQGQRRSQTSRSARCRFPKTPRYAAARLSARDLPLYKEAACQSGNHRDAIPSVGMAAEFGLELFAGVARGQAPADCGRVSKDDPARRSHSRYWEEDRQRGTRLVARLGDRRCHASVAAGTFQRAG